MSIEIAPTTLVKNAKLWRWADDPSVKTGFAVPSSWFCVHNGIICDFSFDDSNGRQRECPPEERFLQVIDAKDQLVIPGLHDAHIHVCMTGESNYFLNLKHCKSIDEVIENLSAHSSKYPESTLPWIQGINWDQVRTPDSGDMITAISMMSICSAKTLNLRLPAIDSLKSTAGFY